MYVNQFILVLPNTDRLSDVINFAVLGNYTDYVVWVHWVHPGRVWVHLGAALSNVGLDKQRSVIWVSNHASFNEVAP